VAGHSGQFTPVNCETHCVSGNRTHNPPIVSPTRYQYLVLTQLFTFFTVRTRACHFIVKNDLLYIHFTTYEDEGYDVCKKD